MKHIARPIVASALFFSINAHAGILADLDSMFMSNATPASKISTADRVGVFGGSFSMRSPISSANLISFDPPRLNAGCGGVDLYGGSFSFINSQQLIQLFRNIASNAAGLAFKAALKVISPQLDALLTEFQTLLQHLNSLAKNSCALAHLIVDPAQSAISNAVDGDGSVGAASTGMFSDAFSSLQGYLNDANSFFAKQGEVNPRSGNQVTKAILASGSSATMGIPGIGNADGSSDDPTNPNSLNNKVLVSILGYEIVGTPCASSNQAGQNTTTQNVSSNDLGRISCAAPPLLTLESFVRGGGPGSSQPNLPLMLYQCTNPSGSGTPDAGGFDPQVCTQMQTINYNYQGIEAWVNNMLFGSADESTIAPTSIVGLMNSGTSGTFTAAQAQFMHQSGIPILGLMSKTSNPTVRESIAHMLRKPIEDCYVAELGRSLYLAANGIQNNNSYVISDGIKKNIERLRVEYLAREDKCLSDHTPLLIAQTINQAAILAGNNNR